MHKSNWPTTRQLRDKFGISTSTPRQWIKRGKIKEDDYAYRLPDSNAKKELIINPMALAEKYKSVYIKEWAEQKPTSHHTEIDYDLYDNLKDYKKEYVDLWLSIFEKFGGMKGEEIKQALAIYKEANPGVSCSYSTYRKHKREYDKLGLVAIIPGWGKRDGDSIVREEDFELFKSLYLKESRPSLESCWGLVRGAAKESGRDVTEEFPHPRTFKRKLKKEVPEQVIYYHRYGESAWNRKYANYIERDKSDIAAGSCWVSDHRQLDVQIYSPDNDKKFRPWITVWMDFKSCKWLSWHIHEAAPNSDHIFQSFKWGVQRFGKPEDIYLDNGKDYRSNDFAGPTTMDHVEKDQRTAIRIMDITPHFALPYNAQAKNLERSFRNSIELLEKHLEGYTGKNSVERPTSTRELAPKDAISKEKFYEIMDTFIEDVINRKSSEGKEHNGISPNELFYSEFKTKKAIRPETLRAFCMRTSQVATIGRNGVNDSSIGKKYWADWMIEKKGKKVYMRRDLKAYLQAWVYDAETHAYLGEAETPERINGIVTDDIGRDKLREAMAEKRHEKRVVRDYVNLESPGANDIVRYAVANQDVDEEIRRANGDFVDYDPDSIDIVEMTNTTGDEMLREKERIDAKNNPKDDDIMELPVHKKAKKFKGLFDEEETKTGTD